MRILMLETRRGSEDGFVVRRFCRGLSYEVADTLARAFIRAEWAVLVECGIDSVIPAEAGILWFYLSKQ